MQRHNVASATIKNTYDQLAACCRMLVDSGDLPSLPWGDVSKFRGGSGWRPDKVVNRKKMRCCTTIAEVVALVSVAQADDRIKWDQGLYSDRSLVVAFLIFTGLRQAEAAGLSWQSLSLDTSPPLLRVDRQGRRGWQKRTTESAPHEPTKTRTDRSQVLHPTAVTILRAQRAELARRGWYRFDGPVWPGREGHWRTSGVVLKPEKMKAYARAAGLAFPDEWTTHSTRHSFACLEVVASRGDLKRVQARTGHADVRQLEGYLHYAGNLLGASDVPEIPIDAPAFGKLPDGSGDLVAADPWGIEQLPGAPPVQDVTRDLALKWKEQRKAERAWVSDECKKQFPQLAIEWLSNLPNRKAAKNSELPVGVRIKAKQAYSRGYRQAEREGKPPELCAKAGKHGRQGVLGAWAKAVKAALRSRLAAPRLPPATVDIPPPIKVGRVVRWSDTPPPSESDP